MSSGRLAVVLSSGGVAGIAHLGILERLHEAGIRLDILIGSSAGALVAAYYAGLGDPLPRLIKDAAATTPLRLGAMALHLWGFKVPDGAARDHCLHLAARLAALDDVTFDTLRGPVGGLGVLAFDWRRMGPLFACTGSAETGHLSVGHVVRGSASVPLVFPPKRLEISGVSRWLSDGGLVRSLPIEWAFSPPLAATHALAVQLPTFRAGIDRRLPARRRFLAENGDRLLVVMPRVRKLRNALRGRRGLEEIFQAGREALDETSLETLRRWQDQPPRQAPTPRLTPAEGSGARAAGTSGSSSP